MKKFISATLAALSLGGMVALATPAQAAQTVVYNRGPYSIIIVENGARFTLLPGKNSMDLRLADVDNVDLFSWQRASRSANGHTSFFGYDAYFGVIDGANNSVTATT